MPPNHFATHDHLLEREFDANAAGHDPTDLGGAKTLATQFGDRIPCGILYQRGRTLPLRTLASRVGVGTTCVEEVPKYEIGEYRKKLQSAGCILVRAPTSTLVVNRGEQCGAIKPKIGLRCRVRLLTAMPPTRAVKSGSASNMS